MIPESLTAIVVVIGAENGCLNFARAAERRGGAGMGYRLVVHNWYEGWG